jgi:hypothetical protein
MVHLIPTTLRAYQLRVEQNLPLSNYRLRQVANRYAEDCPNDLIPVHGVLLLPQQGGALRARL